MSAERFMHTIGAPNASRLWYTAVAVALAGVLAVGGGWIVPGLALLAIGGGALAIRALAVEFRVAVTRSDRPGRRAINVALGGFAFALALAFATDVMPTGAPLRVRLVILALGIQALFLTIDVVPSGASWRARVFLLIVTHGVLLIASAITLFPTLIRPRVAMLLYGVGFYFLAMHAFWTRRQRPGVTPPKPETQRRYWEALLLTAVITGMGAVTVVAIQSGGTLTELTPLTRSAAVLWGVTAVVTLASLGVPSKPPTILKPLTGPKATIAQHVLTLLVLTNALALAVFLYDPLAFVIVLTLVLGLVAGTVAINYLELLYAIRRQPDEHATRSLEDTPPVTVVITALNEAQVLPETLPANSEELRGIRLLFVPAAGSVDRTTSMMKEAASAHEGPAHVVEGTSGTKAGDLMQALEHVETPYVAFLDADEELSRDVLARSLDILTATPDLGVIQGRKVATYPSRSRLSRFVTVERQHSTWIHHPFIHDMLQAGHFAGSAAVFRRDALLDVDGLRTDMLTEDIDVTIRLYLETEWDVRYDPNLNVPERNPGTWTSLVRQRERWARGWAQVAFVYMSDVLSSWRSLGSRRTLGLYWELFAAVSAPIYTIFPALLGYWFLGLGGGLPLGLSIGFALLLLPERGLSFAYASLGDPAIPTTAGLRKSVAAALTGYLWLGFGWVIQLHSMYLQLAGTREVWEVTEKQVLDHPEGDELRTPLPQQL